MNNVTLIGRLTAEPVIKEVMVNNEKCSLLNFSIAVVRERNREKTDFIRCAAFRNTAEFIAKYFIKGEMIGIKGCIEVNQYENDEGKKKESYSVIVESVEFVSSKNGKCAEEHNSSSEPQEPVEKSQSSHINKKQNKDNP